MGLFSLTVQLDKKTKRLLEEINIKLEKLLKEDDKLKQEIMDKLSKATKDIESTV